MSEGRVQPIHIFHHSLRRTGGKERYAIALATAFRDLGHEVTFHARVADPGLAEELKIGLKRLPLPAFPRQLQSFFFFRAVERARPAARGLQIALSRVPVSDVLISGGTHRGYLERAHKWKGPFDWLQIRMEQRAYAAARRIVAHADLIARELRDKYGVQAQKLSTLYAPVDARFQGLSPAFSREEQRARLGWPRDKVLFLFPSSGHSRKGLSAVVEALRYFRDQAALIVAGRTVSGSESFVRAAGYVEDMASAYRAADFTMLGSYYEPFGLVGPESILCGTRLVFEENIGCLPAIQPEFVSTFNVWDNASIRHAISRALELARARKHGIADPLRALRYDPSPLAHARAILSLAG